MLCSYKGCPYTALYKATYSTKAYCKYHKEFAVREQFRKLKEHEDNLEEADVNINETKNKNRDKLHNCFKNR